MLAQGIHGEPTVRIGLELVHTAPALPLPRRLDVLIARTRRNARQRLSGRGDEPSPHHSTPNDGMPGRVIAGLPSAELETTTSQGGAHIEHQRGAPRNREATQERPRVVALHETIPNHDLPIGPEIEPQRGNVDARRKGHAHGNPRRPTTPLLPSHGRIVALVP